METGFKEVRFSHAEAGGGWQDMGLQNRTEHLLTPHHWTDMLSLNLQIQRCSCWVLLKHLLYSVIPGLIKHYKLTCGRSRGSSGELGFLEDLTVNMWTLVFIPASSGACEKRFSKDGMRVNQTENCYRRQDVIMTPECEMGVILFSCCFFPRYFWSTWNCSSDRCEICQDCRWARTTLLQTTGLPQTPYWRRGLHLKSGCLNMQKYL